MEDAEEAVESLRSGEAAGVAAKQMMARRGSAGRPLSKLTPGTVKYAVYFVLAFEGPRGLSVADIVQKVQVSRGAGALCECTTQPLAMLETGSGVFALFSFIFC